MTDPEQLFVDYQARLDEAQRKAEQVRAGLSAITATERSADGQVTVTVNASGNVTDLRITPGGRQGAELAQAVMNTMRRAQSKLASAVQNQLPPAIADELTRQYSGMYPAPPPEPPQGPRRTMRLGAQPDATPARRRRAPRPGEQDDTDYSNRGLLR